MRVDHDMTEKKKRSIIEVLIDKLKTKPATREEIEQLKLEAEKLRLQADMAKSKEIIRKSKENKLDSMFGSMDESQKEKRF